jgi:hypothetical protein
MVFVNDLNSNMVDINLYVILYDVVNIAYALMELTA